MNSAAAAGDFAGATTQSRTINPWVVAIVVTMATFMEILDTTIANVALPHIAGGLSSGIDESTWILTSYLVANAVVLPMSAWLSRYFGRKNYYMTCVALFTVSSFLCGLAPSLGMLIFFRVLQGIGGAAMLSIAPAIHRTVFPNRLLGRILGLNALLIAASTAIASSGRVAVGSA